MLSYQNSSKQRKKILLRFGLFTLGIVLNFAGYLVLLGLQSSINIEDGAGAASVTATYVTSAVFGITFTPVLLRRYGAKVCVILSEITYLVYILINYYPEYHTLIPGGIIVGIGEATMWPAMILFCVYYARSYACHAAKSSELYITEFIGTFYLIFQFSAVVGNLLSYGVLYGGKTPIPTEDLNGSTPTPSIPRDLSICGGNDCQDPNITNENSNRYEPASQTLIYILIGVTAGLVTLALLIQIFFIEKVDSTDKNEYSTTDTEDKVEKIQTKKPSAGDSISSTLQATFYHLLKPKQLLITPLALYSGLVIYFGLGEVNRAFGSCIFGLEQVGLLAAITGGADGLTSYVTSKISSRFGYNVTMLFGFCFDIAFYMTCLLWTPNQSSKWVAYLIFVGIGISDGTWQPLVNELHNVYFPNQLDIALSVWNMYVVIGLAWQAGWSTSLCVYEKVYFHIAFLVFSVACYAISQYIYFRKKPSENFPVKGTKF